MAQNQNRYSNSNQNRDAQRGQRDEDLDSNEGMENDDHHGDAAFHHETAAHHHDQAARNRREGNHADADRHAQLANVHGRNAEDATERARRFGQQSGNMSGSRQSSSSGQEGQSRNDDDSRGSRLRNDGSDSGNRGRLGGSESGGGRNNGGSSRSNANEYDVSQSGRQNNSRDDESRNQRS